MKKSRAMTYFKKLLKFSFQKVSLVSEKFDWHSMAVFTIV